MHGLALFELGELLAEQFPVDSVRMVEVLVTLLLVREVAGVFVVGVLGDDHHFFFQTVLDGLHHRGFS